MQRAITTDERIDCIRIQKINVCLCFGIMTAQLAVREEKLAMMQFILLKRQKEESNIRWACKNKITRDRWEGGE